MTRALLFLILWLASIPALAIPSDCTGEQGLEGRSDVVICEQWESSAWWQTRWKNDGRKTSPIAADGPDSTEIVSTGCISGNCLKVNCFAYDNGGCGGAVAHHLPIPGTRDEVWLRYYLKLASNWTPENLCGTAQPSLCGGTPGVSVTSGGKWPGLADTRTSADASGQCGNGGDFSDGINCWSARLKYRDCLGSGGSDICTANPGSEDTTRVGFYWYLPPNTSNTNQTMGPFDNRTWGTQGESCTTDDGQGNTTDNTDTSANCGIGAAGLKNDVWYRIELHIKMNTAGVNDGVAEAWINGTLKYRKTNVMFRDTGHDNLHVRNVWLDFHAGGEGVGPPADTYALIDQLVVTTKGRAGAFKGTGTYASNAFSVTVNTPSSNGGACNSTGGSTYLEAAANGILPGDYCVLSMTGMNFALIEAPDGGGNVLEYANKGVYDPVNGQIRYVGAEDTTPTTAGIGVKYLKYILSTNTWSTETTPYSDDQSHTWDTNAIDPATGCNYVVKPRSTETYRWCGSSWASLPTNSAFSGEIPACTWDSTRGGLLCWGERNTGLQLWTPDTGNALPGSWSEIYTIGSCSGQCTDFAIAYDAATHWVYLSGGTSTSTTYRRYSPTGTMTSHSSPSSIDLKCCGSGGRLTAYDYRTGKVVVADPFGQRIWQLDIANDTWTDKGAVGPPLNQSFTGNVHGIVTSISGLGGGVLMYVMYRGTSTAPSAYLYKHN